MDARRLTPDDKKFDRKKPSFFCKTLGEYVTPDELPHMSVGDFLCLWAETKEVLATNHPETAPGRIHTARCFSNMCELLHQYKFGGEEGAA